MKALIGSKALAFHTTPEMLLEREPRDTDILASFDDIQKYHKSLQLKGCYPFNGGKKYFAQDVRGNIYESEIAWEGSNSERLLELIKNDPKTITSPFASDFLIPSLDVLYMLKMSHRYLKNSPHFLKTMEDIHWMRKAGAKIRPEHEEFYKERMAVTYDYGHPSLKRTREDFFSGDGIEYEYIHDDIHEVVKFFDKPAYTYFSGGEVWSDMDKFEKQSEDIKLHAVLEESLVLAAERSQLPFTDVDPDYSFSTALMKVCTSITSGRFREYSWENYHTVMDMYNSKAKNYMDKVWKGVEDGVIRKI